MKSAVLFPNSVPRVQSRAEISAMGLQGRQSGSKIHGECQKSCHFPGRFGLILLLILFAAILSPSGTLVAETTINFHRLSFQLPGDWQLRNQGKILTASRASQPGTLIMITEPSDLRTWTIRGFLENGMVSMERQEQRKLVKAFPEQVAEGLTKRGTGFAFQGRVTRDAKGAIRYAAYYAFAAGARFQTVIIFADSPTRLEGIIKLFGPAFDELKVSFSPTSVRPASGTRHGFFNYTLQHPAHWKQVESPYANLSVYSPRKLPGSDYVFGDTNNFVVEYELQPGNPVSPVAALASYLSNRSTTYYKSWSSAEDALRITRIDEIQLPDGRQLVGLALVQTNDDRFYLGAWMISGPGYSLIIASGFKLFRYDLIKRGSTAAIENRAWYNFYDSLPSIASTVNWDNSMIQRSESSEKFLLGQGSLRYHREANISGSGISVFSSNRVQWDFLKNNRVRYKMDKFSSFNSYEYNPATNQQDTSSGYLTRKDQAGENIFQVWKSSAEEYIIVIRPAGVATFHRLTTSPFTIDGFRHGCCR